MRTLFRLVTLPLIALCLTVTATTFSDEALAARKFNDVKQGWSFNKGLPANFKKYGYRIVKKADGHPVRDGKKSMRFEVRAGDCSWSSGWSDCKNDRERHELQSRKRWSGGEYWYHWSIFLPENYPVIYPVKVALAQFHQKDAHVVWMFQNGNGGYFVDNQTVGHTIDNPRILSDGEMRGKWFDILVHVRWTHKKEGFFRVYVNGETKPRYKWTGQTKTKGKKVYYKFGIYRTYVSWKPGGPPTQVVYYDHVNRAKKCERATRYFDCDAIVANESK